MVQDDVTKDDLIDHPRTYSAKGLADYIKSGFVTMDELKEGGQLSSGLRKEVERLIENSEEEDWAEALKTNTSDSYQHYLDVYQEGQYRDEARSKKHELEQGAADRQAEKDWSTVNLNDLEALSRFRDSHPNDPHLAECTSKIQVLEQQAYLGTGVEQLVEKIHEIDADSSIMNKADTDISVIQQTTREDLLGALKKDPNLLYSSVIRKLLNQSVITIGDLSYIGINQKFINELFKVGSPIPSVNLRPLNAIDKECTEIYFWGIPSSGKTCALGGILSAAGNGKIAKTIYMNNGCQGYGYMNWLSNIFHADNVSHLPGSTGFTQTCEMGFDLVDQKGKTHPITLVDTAGELFSAMFWHDADPSKLTEQQQNHLQTVTDILDNNRSTNRKIHFFVIEYGAEKRLYEGLPQETYLKAAVEYIKKTGILDRDTDAIYVILTKSDNAERDGLEDFDDIKAYINNNYASFYNGLVKLSEDDEINGGHVDIIPFTLGEVCFRDFCLFDDQDSQEVVKTILERSYANEGRKLGKLKNMFRG